MSPRAVGVRTAYAAVPAEVRAWVDRTLASRVVRTSEQVGGMSPGCATRLECADSRRAFVKAVGTELNADSPTLFRREIEALGLIGSDQLWPSLIAAYDDGDWVAVLLEDVDGEHPDLSDDATMDRLLAQTDDLVAVLGSRVPRPSRPASADSSKSPLFRPGPVDLHAIFVDLAASLDQVSRLPEGAVPPWVGRNIGRLYELADLLLSASTDHAVHYDARDDNLLVRPDGALVFLDWGAFGVSPRWLDPLLARLERVDSPWFDTSLDSSPALREAGGDVTDAWLVTTGVHMAWRAETHTPQNLPTLQAFRRRESAGCWGLPRAGSGTTEPDRASSSP